MRVRGIATEEKEPCIFFFDDEHNVVKVCCYGKVSKMTKQQFQEHRRFPRDSEFTLIPAFEPRVLEQQYKDYDENKGLLKQSYFHFKQIADRFKEETNGEINLYKTGTFVKTALQYFALNNKYEPDRIVLSEIDFIQNSAGGPMIQCIKGYKGKGYKYDFCSMYPSIMCDPKMLFPIKKGKKQTFTKEQFNDLKFFPFGIYRAIVHKPEMNVPFVFNSNNYYTHIDLTRAKELKLKIELVEVQNNVLLYDRKTSLVQGHHLFGKFVKDLFKLKQKKVPHSKNILNSLWGGLVECNVIKMTIDLTKEFEVKDGKEIISMCPLNDNKMMIHLGNPNQLFETDFARIKPFVLSKGRYLISKTIEPYYSHIKRIHTDGFISDIPLDIETGDDLGDIKYEGYCDNVEVHNNNKVTGAFEL